MYKWRLTYTRDYLDEELKPVQEKLLELLISNGKINRDDLESLAYEHDWYEIMVDEALVELAKKMGWNADPFMDEAKVTWEDNDDDPCAALSIEMTDEAAEYLIAHQNNTPCAALAGSHKSSPT